MGWAPPSNFKFCAQCELVYVVSGNSAHYVNTIFFCTVLKFILTDFFISLTWELTYHSSLSVPSPKLSPHLQRKPNAYGIPIKNECWFLHTNIDSRATPTLAWKGETGNKKQFFFFKSEGSAQLILREARDFWVRLVHVFKN